MKRSSRWKKLLGNLSSFWRWDMGVDLGSSNILIYLKERGVVVEEPSMLARQKKKRWTGLSAPRAKKLGPVAFGLKAKEMVNREPGQLEVVSPIKNGIVSDLEAVQTMVNYYMRMIYEIPIRYPKFLKPRVVVGVPSYITDVQKRAVRSIFLAAGAFEVTLVEGTVLAALGLGMPVDKSSGVVIVDVGGGKTEVAVISMGGVVVGTSLKVAGKNFDEAIINYVKMKYGLLIGPNTAERVKVEIGNLAEGNDKTSLVRGRDLESGLPRSIKLTEAEVREAISLEAGKIAKAVREVMDQAPPELMEDILKRGIILVGNGARLRGLTRMIEKETKIPTRLADDAGWCAIKGCGELAENRERLKQIKLVSAVER